jgi:flagellar biosynthetic protein FlhB
MAEESDLERTEQPTQRRLELAREEGQVARSRELSTYVLLAAGGGGVWLMGSMLGRQLIGVLQQSLVLDSVVATQPEYIVQRLNALSVQTLLTFAPLLILLAVAAVASPLLMNGWMFSWKPLQPNFSKLNPVAGFGRMFSTHSLVELLKSLLKLVIVGGIGALVIWHRKDEMLQLMTMSLQDGIPHMLSLVWGCFIAIMGGMLLIVAVDVPFQLWEHNKRLKMTRAEIRQDMKESEGDPHVRNRIRSMQREMARRRMMAEVPKADVVVTNPTHYAVALRYAESSMRAPEVVAKGSDKVAARIREIAMEHDIPLLEAPPLARALNKHVEIGQAIPEALYLAVAEVLAYVYQLRRYRSAGGGQPTVPLEIPVPEGFDPAAEAPVKG